jgi:hypothetical protein
LLWFLQIASFLVQMWCVAGQNDGFSPDACDIVRSERHITVEMMYQGAESCFCWEIAASCWICCNNPLTVQLSHWFYWATKPRVLTPIARLPRIRFHGPTCRACPVRQACTQAKDAPRRLTVRLQTHHEALQTARQRQETPEFTAQYALRAGVESSLSQGIRRFDLRQSRYRGFARAHLQQLLTATAMNVVRVIAWLWGEPLGERRRQPGHFAQLAPYPLSRQAVLG